MPENDPNNTPVTQIGAASRGHASQALIVQAHSLSVTQQPLVNVDGFDKLKPIGLAINDTLGTAKNHANHYLNTLLPNMIATVTDIDGYINVQTALASALDPSKPKAEAVELLKAAQESTQDYKRRSNELVIDLGKFRGMLSDDASAFSRHASDLQIAVDGDQGLLKGLDEELGSIDAKIGGAIAGTVLSGLAILGGVFMVAVGAIAGFVTAGTSTPLVMAGIGVIAVGVGGEVASSITLANLVNMKGDLLSKKAHLTEEVRLASGLQTGMRSLFDSATEAATATQEMANSWTVLERHLGNLASNIERGVDSTDAVRRLLQRAAQGDVKNVQTDVQRIYAQLEGVEKIVRPSAKLSLVIVEEAHKRAA